MRALTGTDPDRLKEEKERGITIDLGFAHTALAEGLVASFVRRAPRGDRTRASLILWGGWLLVTLLVSQLPIARLNARAPLNI